MARIDKYDPVDGGFRAPLNAAYTGAPAPVGVGLNSSGRVVAGAGVTGVVGVVCSPRDHVAGDPIDIMTDGELVEFAGAVGTVYFANGSTGVISDTPSDFPIGFTSEATRLIVRVRHVVSPVPSGGDALVVPQSAIVDFTDNSGGSTTTPNTIAAITEAENTGSADLAPTANAIAKLAAKIDEIIAALTTAGVLDT